MRLVLLGPPGAGKGTQAVRLAARLDVPHVSTGDLFRAHLHDRTPLGFEAQAGRHPASAGGVPPGDRTTPALLQRSARLDRRGR
jgi:adenylate kinase